jgi:hypothetical protein
LDDDFRQLKNSRLVESVASTIDTLPIARKLGCLRPGLKTLCQAFLGHNICKQMQVSNWEAEELSQEQLTYAATDAWAPLEGNHTFHWITCIVFFFNSVFLYSFIRNGQSRRVKTLPQHEKLHQWIS